MQRVIWCPHTISVHDVQAAMAKPAVKSKSTKKDKQSAKGEAQPAAADQANARVERDEIEGKGTTEQASGKRKRGARGDAAAVLVGAGQTKGGKKRKPVANDQADNKLGAADGVQGASEGSRSKGKRGDGEASAPPKTEALPQQTAAANAGKAPASAAASREAKGAVDTGGEASVAVPAAVATAQPRKAGRLSRKVPQAATAKAEKQPSAPKAQSKETGAEKAVATPASGAARHVVSASEVIAHLDAQVLCSRMNRSRCCG